jgi:predicted MFS family arabinose efflux permease
VKLVTAGVERRFVVAAIAAIGVGYGFGRYAYGLFLPRLQTDFALSFGATGAIGSATYAGYLAALVGVGLLTPRVGPRVVVVVGTVSAAAGLLLVAAAPNTTLLVIGLVLAGTSSGWVWTPFADAAHLMLAPDRRGRVLAIIPSGTAFALVIAGPLALVSADGHWRLAWVAFAGVAIAAALYNGVVLARGPLPGRNRSSTTTRSLLRKAARPLFLTAAAYGAVGAVYWTFAVAAISTEDGGRAGPLFWTLTGAAGVLGILAGPFLAGTRLRTVHVVLLSALAGSTTLLAVAPGLPAAVVVSGAGYGLAFMATSGLLAVWSDRVFPDAPTSGFTLTTVCLGLGSVVGPITMGTVADGHGLRLVFLITAAVAVLALFARPAAEDPVVHRLSRA